MLKQEYIKGHTFNICFPAFACPWSYVQWRENSFAMVEVAPSMRKTLSGFSMSVFVSFRGDYHNAVGLGIRCIFTWETKEGHFDRIERVFKCWAPTEAPGVRDDHIFVLYDAEMHPGGGEGIDQKVSAELKFEFQTVSGENKPLGADCLVTKCDVKAIMDSKGDTSFSVVSRASEDIRSVEERLSPLPKKPEAKFCYSPSSKPHKRSTVASKVKSKRDVFSRWVSCVPQVRKIKREKKRARRSRRSDCNPLETLAIFIRRFPHICA